MPRTVHTTVSTAIEQPVTAPEYLVELGFDTVLRGSTHQQREWDGKTWLPLGVVVSAVTPLQASIELRNADNSASALVLAHNLADVDVAIYQCYDGEAELLHRGVLDGAPELGLRRVRLSSRGHSGAAQYPVDRIAAPEFNHIVPAGTDIRWGSDTVVLESSPR